MLRNQPKPNSVRQMKLRTVVIPAILLVFALLSTSANAAIILRTNHDTGNPVIMNAGDGTSTTMTVSIFSNVLDNLAGWGVSLDIIALGGATGSVQYNSAAVAATNYVFGAPTAFFNIIIPAGNLSLNALDANIPVVGNPPIFVQIPPSPGLNLLDLDFSASLDASGTFGIFARGGVGNSEWTDPNFIAQPFANVGGFGQSDQIGEIFVVSVQVPEPGTLDLLGAGLLGLAFARRREAA